MVQTSRMQAGLVATMIATVAALAAAQEETSTMVTQTTAAAMGAFDSFLGEYEGTIQVFAQDGAVQGEAPILWNIEPAMFGRAIRHEFAAEFNGQVSEWLGLFGFDDESGEYTTYWVNSGIRNAGYDLTEREFFAERGTFDEAGRVLTLRSTHKTDADGTMVEYRSTFTFRDGGFTCVDEQQDATTGEWWTIVVFELERADGAADAGD